MEEELSDQELIDSIVPRRAQKNPYEIARLERIHSEEHLLAKDISEYCGEPKKFAMYLGVIKRIGKQRSYEIFSEIKNSRIKPKTPGKLFMYKSAKSRTVKSMKS